MTFPEGSLESLLDAPRDQPVFASWLLAFGFVPFDRHVFVLHDAGPRLITDIPQRAVPESRLMLCLAAMWAVSHGSP